MRNLKKTLCLVLALVFVLGLCTVGAAAAADYGDEDAITYETAVAAMSGLGILQGDDNDGDGVREFRPKDPVTRAQAAKIISYIVLGKENAEKWPASGDAFTDVSASHWAARYIAYCSFAGIINGVGDGTFHPDDHVTQVAFAKMLLASAGYGKKNEFIGTGWDQNVVAIAMTNKITKGMLDADVNWYDDATREETAQLAYNSLLNVAQVVLSSDTNSYVPMTVGGGTFGSAVWNLEMDTGVVISNKTNAASAKGTVLSGTGTRAYYVTEEDENPMILGHKVRITYRLEDEIAVAYYVEDLCTEVNGAEAAKLDDAATTYNFTGGQLVSSAIPAKSVRATTSGTFILDEDGKVLSYRTGGFFIATLTANAGTGGFSVTEPYGGTIVAVNAPAAAKAGDIVTVFKNGDIYTAKATVKQTGVAITQKQLDANTGYYTYNNGAIYLSKAELLSSVVLLGMTKMNGTPQLDLGYSYTLYFDSEGGCIGFADKVSIGTTVTDSFVFLITRFTGTDTYGSTIYYAQVLKADGSSENLVISKDTYDLGLASGVYKLGYADNYATLIAATGSEFAYELYTNDNPLNDYSQATFVWYQGAKGSLEVKTGILPQLGSYVYYTYKTEKEGTVTVKKIKTVWFTVTSSTGATAENSFVYLADTAAASSAFVNGKTVNYYKAYKDGVAMEDLCLSSAPSMTGLASYSKDPDGYYTLTFIPAGNGSATSVRTFTLVAEDINYYFLNNMLYVKNLATGGTPGMDLTGVKIVKVGAAESSTVAVETVEAIQTAILNGYKITVSLVEVVSGETHSIGGGAIYVTAITP